MLKIILIAVAVACAILAVGLMTPPTAKVPSPSGAPHLVHAGHFVIEQAGVAIAHEAYTLLYSDMQGYLLVSQATLTVQSQSIGLAQQLELNPTFGLRSYQLRVELSSGSQSVSALRGEGGVRMEVRSGSASQVIDVSLGSDMAILDNTLASHYVTLWMALDAGAIGHDFTALVPQRLLSLPAHLLSRAAAQFTSAGVRYAGELWRVSLGDLEVDLLAYGKKLVGLFIRAQAARIYDADLFPAGISLPSPENQAGGVPKGVIEQGVRFQSGDVTLAGTLALPEQSGSRAVPAVVFLHGSGPVDRNEDAPGLAIDAFRELAFALAEQGVASFRYDKRGVGESGGMFATASRADLLADARAALATVRGIAAVDAARVILVGHSEGGYLAPILAAADKTIAGLVLLASPARSLDLITRWQVETMARLAKVPDAELTAALAQEDQFIGFVKGSQGEWSDYSSAALMEAMPWATEEQLRSLRAVSLAWLRENYLDDPRATLRQVACPVLAVQGEKDLQVPPTELDLLAETLRQAGNVDVTAILLPDLNHLLRHHPEEPNLTYQHLDEPVDPRVIAAVTAWVVARGKP